MYIWISIIGMVQFLSVSWQGFRYELPCPEVSEGSLKNISCTLTVNEVLLSAVELPYVSHLFF